VLLFVYPEKTPGGSKLAKCYTNCLAVLPTLASHQCQKCNAAKQIKSFIIASHMKQTLAQCK